MTTPRQHLGSGRLTLHRDLSVFINCPFDDGYRPLFDSIVFATICCGFMPRCAIESGTASVARMDRIAEALRTSKYSIHDLSRCKGEGSLNIARFNMPLELGIAMGEKLRADASAPHDWLVLVPEGHEYQQFVSDLSGFDPSPHDGTEESVIAAVMSWLATRPDAVQCPTPAAVYSAMPTFSAALDRLRGDWSNRAPWSDVVMLAISSAQGAALVPAA